MDRSEEIIQNNRAEALSNLTLKPGLNGKTHLFYIEDVPNEDNVETPLGLRHTAKHTFAEEAMVAQVLQFDDKPESARVSMSYNLIPPDLFTRTSHSLEICSIQPMFTPPGDHGFDHGFDGAIHEDEPWLRDLLKGVEED